MRTVTADTHTWLAARAFLLERCDDFYLQLTVVREAFDPEAIHDLRVSSRRLREGLSLFGHCFRKRQLAPIRSELKGLTAMLGSIRNTDEAILFFFTLETECAADTAVAAAVAHIVTILQSRRVAELRHLKRALKKIDPGSLLGRIDYLCNNPRIFDPDVNSLFQPVAATLLDAVAMRETAVVELLPEAVVAENVSAQHRLRIAIKRFRYRFEFMAPLAAVEYKRIYSLVKAYQEVLGHMHDMDVFSGLTGEIIVEAEERQTLTAIISDRRRTYFADFLQLQSANPLEQLCAQVQDLL